MGLRRFQSERTLRELHARDDVTSAYDSLGLKAALTSADPHLRRDAVRQASQQPEAVEILLEHLHQEADPQVLESLMLALEMSNDERVVADMFTLLASENTWLRNRAQEVLLLFPEKVMEQVGTIYAQSSNDEKIFLMNVMKDLAHPGVGAWVLEILEKETHVNVVATALETVAEIGDAACLPLLDMLIDRFAEEPFIAFTVGVVRERVLTS